MSKDILTDSTHHPTACDVLYDFANQVIVDNAIACLRQTAYPELWKITCHIYEGVLTLNGAVGSYFLKQLAYAAVAGVKGVETIVNQLEVRDPTAMIKRHWFPR